MAARKIRPIRVEGQLAYVTLTQGYEAVIDASDVQLVAGFNWYAKPHGRSVYAARTDAVSGQTVRMHRLISQPPSGAVTDHIDGDGLNNRRGNLRHASHVENCRNQRLAKNNTSGFKGVSWHKARRKWITQIAADGGRASVYFDTQEEAHAAYVKASRELHKEFGRIA